MISEEALDLDPLRVELAMLSAALSPLPSPGELLAVIGWEAASPCLRAAAVLGAGGSVRARLVGDAVELRADGPQAGPPRAGEARGGAWGWGRAGWDWDGPEAR